MAMAQPRILQTARRRLPLGPIFEGNNCTNCPVFYYLTRGNLDTIIWNSNVNGAIAQTPVVQDVKIWNTATQASAGTVVGHD
jgi:hypothetical protein